MIGVENFFDDDKKFWYRTLGLFRYPVDSVLGRFDGYTQFGSDNF